MKVQRRMANGMDLLDLPVKMERLRMKNGTWAEKFEIKRLTNFLTKVISSSCDFVGVPTSC